jgi:hypothetical protein
MRYVLGGAGRVSERFLRVAYRSSPWYGVVGIYLRGNHAKYVESVRMMTDLLATYFVAILASRSWVVARIFSSWNSVGCVLSLSLSLSI